MKNHFKRNWFWYFLTTVLLGAGVFLHFSAQLKISELQSKLDDEKNSRLEKMDQVRDRTSEEHLYLLSKTFAWAMRGAILRKNMDEAEQIIQQFVLEPRIRSVSYLNRRGKIVLASDKNQEGKNYRDFYEKDIIQDEQTNVMRFEHEWLLASPVMSLSERIGTVLIYYDPKAVPQEGPTIK